MFVWRSGRHMKALCTFYLGNVSTEISFFNSPRIQFLRDKFWCVLVFGNIAVYWQISKNLSPGFLLSFNLNQFKVSVEFVCQRGLDFEKEKEIQKFDFILIDRLQLWQYCKKSFYLHHWHCTCQKSIFSIQKNEVHTKLQKFYYPRRFSHAKYVSARIYPRKN